MNPTVSIIMPVYNSELYVADTVRSILAQTFEGFEFIIINDGSTDQSAAVIESFKDERIRFYNFTDNQGYVNRLNFALSNANGKYVARMDSDDIALPQRLEKQVQFMDDHPEHGVCGTQIEFFGHSGPYPKNWVASGNDLKVHLLFNNVVCHPTTLIRRELLLTHHIQYQTDFEPTEDYLLWVQLSKYAKVANLSEVLLKYRVHPQQVSSQRLSVQFAKCKTIIRQQIEQLGIQPTPAELEVHYSVSFNEVYLQVSYLPKLKRWLRKLGIMNKKTKVYDQSQFDLHLREVYQKKRSQLIRHGKHRISLHLIQPLKKMLGQ